MRTLDPLGSEDPFGDDETNHSPDAETKLDVAFAVYLKACDSGDLSSREEFLQQFPELAVELRELMDAADLLDQFSIQGSPVPGDPISSVEPALTVGADRLGPDETSGAFSNDDPAATLPMGTEAVGSGPTLPFSLGDYTLLKVLGVGGMGVVYLAEQEGLDRKVAVKMIRSGMLAGETEVRRFYKEAQAAAKLQHPGVVAVYQFGQRAGHHFFSMQYIDGEDLHRIITRGPLDPRRAARIVRDVSLAIDYAHQNHVLHRDLKPANVMITAGDRVHITDFGLAKDMAVDSDLTGSGVAVGTPHFMAPEQALGNSSGSTVQSDVYSLGAILFAALTGRPPLVGSTVLKTLMKVAHDPSPPLRSVRPELDADIEAIVEKCLEKRQADRYSSAADLAADLDRYLSGGSIRARARGKVRRVCDWLLRIPLVAALCGRPTADSSDEHRRFQTGMLAAAFLLPLMLLAGLLWRQHVASAMPRHVRIAGGLPGGQYTDASKYLANQLAPLVENECLVLETKGSWDNRDRLLRREVDLAPMQASALSGDELRVVAPLFYEMVHVLVRPKLSDRQNGATLSSPEDFRGHAIAVGPTGSGSRRAAEMVLDSLGLDAQVCPRVVTSWPALQDQSESLPDVAMICIGPGSELVNQLLNEGRWQLVPLPRVVSIALQHPTLRPMTLAADVYPGLTLPVDGIDTVGTTAFLVAREDTPDVLVTAALQSLYASPTLPGLIPVTHAAEWEGLAFHPAARRYYDEWVATSD